MIPCPVPGNFGDDVFHREIANWSGCVKIVGVNLAAVAVQLRDDVLLHLRDRWRAGRMRAEADELLNFQISFRTVEATGSRGGRRL